MKKYKKPYTVNRFIGENKGLILVSLIAMFSMWCTSSVLGADANWVITYEAGETYDSITYEHYMGNSGTPDSSGTLCLTCAGQTKTLIVSDSLYHFYYV